MLEYPKFLYHAKEEPRVVASREEEAALGPEWAPHPSQLQAPAEKPAPVIVKKSKVIKDRGEA